MRIEELINYFPLRRTRRRRGDEPFAVNVEVAALPVERRAPARADRPEGQARSTGEKRPPSNLVFLLDVSGSMNEPNKLPLRASGDADARRAARRERPRGDRRLRRGRAAWCCRRRRATHKAGDPRGARPARRPAARPTAARASSSPTTSPSSNFIKGGTNRVSSAPTATSTSASPSQGELTRLIEEKAKSGVFLSVLGFGMGNLKDATMEKLADKGNGNYAYIDYAAGGAQGPGRADERHAGDDRQGREDPGRVQPGAGRRLPPDRLREPHAARRRTSTTTRRTPARSAPGTPSPRSTSWSPPARVDARPAGRRSAEVPARGAEALRRARHEAASC